jgi:hypothetical protein
MLGRVSQQTAFALLRVRERRELARGAVVLQPGLSSVTCVVRLPPVLAVPIHQVVRGLPGVKQHYVYPAADLHLTLLDLGDLRALEEVTEVLRRTAPFRVQLLGLQQSAHSVYVRAFDDSGQLQAVRHRLMGVTGTRAQWPRRRLGFVNVVRYLDADVAGLGPGVRGLQARRFGELEVGVAEVVRTDRVLSAAGTTLVRRTPLAGARSS